MKTSFFYALILLFSICLASCQKENLTDNNKVKNESNQLKMAQVDNYTLNYIGNSQWSGNWNGVQLTFDGPADYQMNDGLMHYYNLSTAYAGAEPCEISSLGDHVWAISELYANPIWGYVTKVDYFNKQTGQVVTMASSWTIVTLSTTLYTRSVSTYTAPIQYIGGYKYITFKCQIIEVDHVPTVCSPIKIVSDPSGPPQ